MIKRDCSAKIGLKDEGVDHSETRKDGKTPDIYICMLEMLLIVRDGIISIQQLVYQPQMASEDGIKGSFARDHVLIPCA